MCFIVPKLQIEHFLCRTALQHSKSFSKFSCYWLRALIDSFVASDRLGWLEKRVAKRTNANQDNRGSLKAVRAARASLARAEMRVLKSIARGAPAS